MPESVIVLPRARVRYPSPWSMRTRRRMQERAYENAQMKMQECAYENAQTNAGTFI